MAEHTFESKQVEEFYNSCHLKDSGRFCGRATGKKLAKHVPLSDNARRSNAILRRLASDRKSTGYKKIKARLASMKQSNKDKSTPLTGKYKTTGNKAKDLIKLTQLDRGSPERKAAAKAFEKAYGG